MKNYLAIMAISALAFVSCKKDRVCNCLITTVGTTATHTQTAGFPPIVAETDTTTYTPLGSINTKKTSYRKVSKKTMRGNCAAKSDESLNQTSSNTSPGIFTITTTDTGTRSYECKIE